MYMITYAWSGRIVEHYPVASVGRVAAAVGRCRVCGRAAVGLCGGVMIRFLRRRRRRAIDFVYKLRFCSRHLFHHASSSERDDHNITRHITARSLLAVFMVANNLFMPLWPSLFREFNHLYVRVSNSRISE